ncbi:MAG: 3-hydroxyacyl-ACP dehydratase FabZ family protein [Bacteroidota bacterium]
MITTTKNTYPKPYELLPHRPPFLLVDTIEGFQLGESLIAIKEVGKDEVFFKGHFPGQPILPGVIIVEMMFQACGLYGRLERLNLASGNNKNTLEKPPSGRAIKINNVSFHKEVKPESKLLIKIKPKQQLMGFSVFDAKVSCEEALVAKGTLTVHIS